jgi:hypothetical protein
MKWRTPLIAVALAFFIGCYSSQQTVRLVLGGVGDDMTWESLQTVLPTLVDGKGDYAMSWSGSRPNSLSLAPVAQPEAFALRINFGMVERIEGRTIYLRVDSKQVHFQAFVIWAKKFIEDFPYYLRGLAFNWRVRFTAWWTGRPQDEVFWDLFNELLTEVSRPQP